MMVRGYLPAPRPADIVYAPVDLAVAIGRGLAKLGHDVHFYGPAGTRLDIPVKTRGLRSLVHNYKEFQTLLNSVDLLTHYMPSLWDQYLSSEMYKRAAAGEYDLLHFHHPETAMSFAGIYPDVPVVYTLHDPIYGWYQEMFALYDTPNQFYVSISNNQRTPAPGLAYAATVYNGIDPNLYSFSNTQGDYLLFVGRVVPEKGVKQAIDIAEATGQRLIIIGPTYEDSQEYFDKHIGPRLNEQVQYLGYVDQYDLWKYYRKAKAILTPIQWEEPFGLTMIEAMACGTPVIGLRRGSIPEIVVHGKTGYIAGSIPEMIKAVGKIDKIDRRACREHVKQHFSINTMVKGYEKAFETVLEQMKVK